MKINGIFVILFYSLPFFIFTSCNNQTEKFKLLKIESFLYDTTDYNLMCTTKESTALFDYFTFPIDTIPRIIYVANGECSSCIAQTIDFLILCKNANGLNIPVILILKAYKSDLFNYSYDNHVTNNKKNDRHFVTYVLDDEGITIKDGAYFIVNNHILKYMEWNIYK